jgi:hypothetical protein
MGILGRLTNIVESMVDANYQIILRFIMHHIQKRVELEQVFGAIFKKLDRVLADDADLSELQNNPP